MIRLAVLVSLCWIGLLPCGCAVMKATQQPNKKDLSILASGTPRTHVIAELGPPVWTETRDGVTTDVFAFRQGYSRATKAGRALFHGAADVATAGLWEVVGIPAETLANGKDVHLEIRYSPQLAVQSVDVIKGADAITQRPWYAKMASASGGDRTAMSPDSARAESGDDFAAPVSRR